jgi:hypothetical protein
VPALVAEVRTPQVAQLDIALQRRVHQHRTAPKSDGGFNDR